MQNPITGKNCDIKNIHPKSFIKVKSLEAYVLVVIYYDGLIH